MTNPPQWPEFDPSRAPQPPYGAPRQPGYPPTGGYGPGTPPPGSSGAGYPPPAGPANYGGPPPTGGHGPGFGPPPGQPPYGSAPGSPPEWAVPARKNRKPLIITASAAVAILVVIAVVTSVLMTSGGSDGGAPTAVAGDARGVVKQYLEALARGDATAALALGSSEPASTDLLTDDILKQQQQMAPLTDIQITEDSPLSDDPNKTEVSVTAKFGGQATEGSIIVTKADGGYKLVDAFANEEFIGLTMNFGNSPPADRLESTLQIFGKPLDPSGHAYVFPGAWKVTSSSPYIDVNPPPPVKIGLGGQLGDYADVKSSMNDKGRKAAEDAIAAWFTKCYSPGPKTGGCASVTNFGTDEYDRTTIALTAPPDLSKLRYDFIDGYTYVTVAGVVPDVHFTVLGRDGQTKSLTVDPGVGVKVSLAKEPAVVEDPPA